MNLRPALQIQTSVSAMRDIVLPAIDPTNKMAVEQANLVIGMLVLLDKTLPLAFRYDRDELTRIVTLALQLQKMPPQSGGGSEAMRDLLVSIATAQDVLERARAEPAELEAAVGALRSKVGDVITALYAEGGDGPRSELSRCVLRMSKDQLLRERAWVLCQGWESEPASLPPIEEVI